MFDILTYEKGAAVVRMLEQFLGPDAFQAGIRRYLAEHAYGNTETTDLWDAIEAANPDVPVRSIMDSWIFQGGFPVVAATADGDRVRLSQQRFTYAGTDVTDGDTTWSVPVLLAQGAAGEGVSGHRVEKLLLDQPETVASIEGADYVVVNAGGSGFHRVRYDAPLLERLVAHGQQALTPLERYGLVDDAWASVLAADMTAADFVALAGGLSDETDLSVWQRLIGALGAVDRLVEGAAQQALQTHVRALVGPAYARLGPDPRPDDGDRNRELRGALLTALGDLGADAEAQERARTLYAAAREDGGSVDPCLLAAAVAILSRLGGEETYTEFLARFRGASTPQEEQRYLYVLADFPDAEQFARTLELSLSDDVRSQNGPYLLRRALTNRERGADAWGYVKEHWDAINGRFPSNSIARLLEGIRSLSTRDLQTDVESFLDDHPVPQGALTVAQHRERLRVNVALRERESDRLAASLP
jgi:puromycin-sensitive aminopeptidase